jgi:hypothetical protein
MKQIILLTIIATLPSCMIMPHYQTLTGKFSGRVVDVSDKPVSGVSVEYLYNSHRRLGKTSTDAGGQFTLGPFRQWFYFVYIGSPGVCPFPYALDGFREYPDALKITTRDGSSTFLIGSKEQFEAEIVPSRMQHITLPKTLRWTGSQPAPKLVLSSETGGNFVPTLKLGDGVLLRP